MWAEEGDFPENLHRVVYVITIKRSFESFHVFGSDFITLAVILVSDYFNTTQRLFELALGTEPNQGVYSCFFVKHPSRGPV